MTRAIRVRIAGTALALVLVLPSQHGPSFAEPAVWQDYATGLAIGGYDPLAYFTRGEPGEGREEVEYRWGGAVWRFLNVGNKGAFARDPEVYAPGFAGYDPYALSIGLAVRGQPGVWARHRGRVYLFHSAVHRRLWEIDPEAVIAGAENNWPAIAASLPGTSETGDTVPGALAGKR